MSGAPRYEKCLRPDNGVRAETKVHSDAAEQAAHLSAILDALKRDKYSPSEVVILSRLAFGIVRDLPRSGWLSQIHDLNAEPTAGIRAGTIHAFKGLEAPVVIVTDIDRVGDPESDALLYVGMSRATERLFVLAHTNTAQVIHGRLLGGANG